MVGLRRQRDAGLRPVTPRFHTRVDPEEKTGGDEPEPGIDGGLLLERSVAQRKRGDSAGEDGEHRQPERPVCRKRMVTRHPADQISGDRKAREDSAERGYRREQETRGSLDALSNREEPGHDGWRSLRPVAVVARAKLRPTCQVFEGSLQIFL
jgi:hypothetical protein